MTDVRVVEGLLQKESSSGTKGSHSRSHGHHGRTGSGLLSGSARSSRAGLGSSTGSSIGLGSTDTRSRARLSRGSTDRASRSGRGCLTSGRGSGGQQVVSSSDDEREHAEVTFGKRGGRLGGEARSIGAVVGV
jgi:hypothetical protein